MTTPEPTKVLLLTIEVPGIWVDDIDELAAEYYDGKAVDYLLEDDGMGMDKRVHITIITHGDESGPMVFSYDGTVVDAATRPL